MISRSTIDQIYQVAIIEEVVGEFVHLKKAGKSYKGLSPFSNERTPSFYVVPSKGIYKDFSSGKGGNVVDFLMQHQKLTYPEALRWLANRYQIPIEEEEDSEQQKKEKSEREQLSIAVEFAQKWFHSQLHETDKGQAIGLSYFLERGFREDTIQSWQLGYAPEGWDHLKKAAESAGYDLQYFVKAGLLKEKENEENPDSEKEKRQYDAFRDRVMFPIHSESGKIIAFAGRTMQADLKGAKYINSPESELFHKSDILYGMHLAKNQIIKQDLCYLVEGYTDVISMYQSGVHNVVASCGTSLTESHIKKIARYTKNITVLFDGDAAGIKASLRSIEMILKQGMNIRIVLFPDGDDPDSFAKKHTAEEIENFLRENSKDFIRFKTQLLLDDAGRDPLKRAELIRDIVQTITLIPDHIQREVYIQECSQLLNVNEETLFYELNKTLRNQIKKANQAGDEIPEIPKPTELSRQPEEFITHAQERDIIRLLLNYGDCAVKIEVEKNGTSEWHEVALAEFIVFCLEQDQLQFEDPMMRKIYQDYISYLDELVFPDIKKFTFHENPEVSQTSTDLITSQYELSDNWEKRHYIVTEKEETNLEKAAKDAVYRLKLVKINRLIEDITKALNEHQSDEEKVVELMESKKMLDQSKRRIAQYFGTVIL
jgi:DNA primase